MNRQGCLFNRIYFLFVVAVRKVDVTCLCEPRMLRGKLREAIRMFISLNGRDCFVTSFLAMTIFFFLDSLSIDFKTQRTF